MSIETLAPLVTGVAWSGVKLIATDEDVVDSRLRRKALSASTSKSMKGCLARFAVEKLLPREDDPFSASALGTSTHAVLEELYNLPAAERTQERFHEIKFKMAEEMWSEGARGEHPEQPSAEEWQQRKQLWLSEVDRLGLGEFKIVDPKSVVVFQNELGFEGVDIAGVPAMGFIDRVEVVEVAGKSAFRAVDLKTGKEKTPYDRNRYGDDHGDQLRIYSDALLAAEGKPAAQAAVHYTQFGNSREVPLTATAMNATRKEFRQSWDIHNQIMARGEFTTKTGPLCGWCPAVNSCPAAALANFKASPKVAKQPVTAVELGIPTVRPELKPLGSKLPPVKPVAPSAAVVIGQIAQATAEQYTPIPHNDIAPPAQDWLPAHDTGDKFDSPMEEAMTTAHLIAEGNPREQMLADKLNGASYAAIAVFSVPQMAAEILHDAGRPLAPDAIDRMTDLLASIIVEVQKVFRGGSFNWGDGLNTRIRGVLRTTITLTPMPWEATDEQAWIDWERVAVKRTTFFVNKGIRLYNFGSQVSGGSFAALLPAQDTTPAEAATPEPTPAPETPAAEKPAAPAKPKSAPKPRAPKATEKAAA
ncbi:RecB family exonuclease [Agromyces sp. NPDC057679]|uniref:RecB family exonuclease n=1 Tax=Agromyces sp. NPDC057679 TaxID=3346207 RepID=UPI0036724792